MVKVNRPRGTRDFLPEDMKKRRSVETAFRDVVERWGYLEVKTPTFETLELFTIKSGEGIINEIYNFTDKGGREMALRPELTAPVMRLYNEVMQRTAKPAKLFYFDNCFRYERPQKGRFREFWQFGVELIGSKHPEAEAEVIALATEMISNIGITGELHVGHLGIIKHIINTLNAEQQGKITRLVDKKDKCGLEDYLEEIQCPISIREKLFPLISLTGKNAIDEARTIMGDIPELNQFGEILAMLDLLGVEYIVDFGIARGLDYYTGMVFEIYCEGLGAQNQVCGGGSYRLTKLFGGQDTPSTGFGLGFDRIMEIYNPAPTTQTSVYVVCFDDTREDALRITQQLRKHTVVHMDLMRRKFKDQLNHANNLNTNFVIILGQDEVNAGKVTLKNMENGTQELLSLNEAIRKITS